MDTQREHDQSFELRSEKVRSIVGQIPSALLRHGITALGVALLALFLIAYLLPYKQVYSGTITLYGMGSAPMTDSVDLAVQLKFERKRPHEAAGQVVSLQSAEGPITGRLVYLSTIRDTLERQEASCRFRAADIQPLAHQTADFQLVQTSGNLLYAMLGSGF